MCRGTNSAFPRSHSACDLTMSGAAYDGTLGECGARAGRGPQPSVPPKPWPGPAPSKSTCPPRHHPPVDGDQHALEGRLMQAGMRRTR